VGTAPAAATAKITGNGSVVLTGYQIPQFPNLTSPCGVIRRNPDRSAPSADRGYGGSPGSGAPEEATPSVRCFRRDYSDEGEALSPTQLCGLPRRADPFLFIATFSTCRTQRSGRDDSAPVLSCSFGEENQTGDGPTRALCDLLI